MNIQIYSYMNVNTLKFNDQKITLCLYLLILINYLSIFFSYNQSFVVFLAYSIVIIFFISIFKLNQNNYLLKSLMLIFLLLSLGSPTFHFDARWIWLLKGKQIFINNNLDFLREEYFQGLVWQSYPLLGPSLSSSLAINEVKKEFNNNLEAERICPTFHSSELSAVFFETLEHTGCYYDPLSILR